MVIRFNIPNGRMEINLGDFLPGGQEGAQIRKMLKVSASPNEKNAREIREWL